MRKVSLQVRAKYDRELGLIERIVKEEREEAKLKTFPRNMNKLVSRINYSNEHEHG